MTTAAVARATFKKGSKVVLLGADYAYGHEMMRGFKRAAGELGAEIVGEILHPFGAADYSTLMPRIRALKPDILAICSFGRDQANSIKQANDFGMKKQMQIVVPVLLHNQRIAVAPDVFEGIIGGANYYWALESTIPPPRPSTTPTRRPMAPCPRTTVLMASPVFRPCCWPWRRPAAQTRTR